MNIDLTEHRLHCLYTLKLIKDLNEQLKLTLERRELKENDTYHDQFEEGIFLTDSSQNVKLFFGGKDVVVCGIEKRLFELIEINLN